MSLLDKFKIDSKITSALPLLGGLLFYLSWSPIGFYFLAFLGFVPFLIHLKQSLTTKTDLRYVLEVFSGFLLWNVLTSWWITNSTFVGGALVILINSVMMSIVLLLTKKVYTTFTPRLGHISLMIFWLAFEYLHFNWGLSWPWLTLGNVFVSKVDIIQWYEFTGVLGGSLWIIAVNYGVYVLLDKSKPYIQIVLLGLTITIPIFLSEKQSNQTSEELKKEVIIVQPNIDPHTEKFPHGKNFIPYENQIDRCLKLTSQLITPKTDLVVWPETVVALRHNLTGLESLPIIIGIKQYLSNYPNANLLLGIETWKEESGKIVYYNSALLINGKGVQIYHKNKLVPGAEKIPFSKWLGWLGDLIQFDGTTNYSIVEDQKAFVLLDGTKIASLICYDSVFGNYTTTLTKQGVGIISVITNDGWWGNTSGHIQHNEYAKIRAIENRKSIVRSANTGISSVINSNGEVEKSIAYDTKDVLKSSVLLNSKQTFYMQNGDFIGRNAAFFGVLMILWLFVRNKVKK